MIPTWLHLLSIVSLGVAFVCAAWIALDVYRRPQHMWIMNLVWPIVALFGSVLTVWFYRAYGRMGSEQAMHAAMRKGEEPPNKAETPFAANVAKGALHCGSGCTLGDILAEWLVFFVPSIAIWAGWQSLFSEKIFAVWVIDYMFAFVIGIAFQYFTIKPMRDLTPVQGLIEALKADVLSLTSWQIGMYGLMAIAQFYVFRHLLGVRLEVNSVEFWFAMQLAMLAGFLTAYPVNWWLIRVGIKEEM